MTTFDVSETFPESLAQVLLKLDRKLRESKVEYVLVGALARDVVTSLRQGTEPERLTKDVDVAVRVSSQPEYEAVASTLPRVGRHAHKFKIDDTEIDVVPYIEQCGATEFHFKDTVLDTNGLAEAAAHSESVRISNNLVIEVASIAVLSLLKIFAWRDRRSDSKKDAIDLNFLFEATSLSPYWEMSWQDDEAASLVDHDSALVGVAWLGREAGSISRTHAKQAALAVLDNLTEELALDMQHQFAGERLAAYRRGFSSVSD